MTAGNEPLLLAHDDMPVMGAFRHKKGEQLAVFALFMQPLPVKLSDLRHRSTDRR